MDDDISRDTGLAQETEKNVAKIIEIEDKQKQERSATDRFADAVTAFFGSMIFVWVHVIWFGVWILINSVFVRYQFDPFPYTFLTLVVSLEAIFLSTFILISQNHETRVAERRNHLDLQINLLAEAEATRILSILTKVAENLGVPIDQDSAIETLTEEIEPAKVIDQIKSATKKSDRRIKR